MEGSMEDEGVKLDKIGIKGFTWFRGAVYASICRRVWVIWAWR